MNGPVSLPQPHSASILPSQFQALCPPSQLLPGENIDHYHAVQAAIFGDIEPQSAIEWLLAMDIAELSWEVQRYRILRHRLLKTYRQKAIEITLRRVDVAGIAPDFQDAAELYTIKKTWTGNWMLLLHSISKLNFDLTVSINMLLAWRPTFRSASSSRSLNHS